MAFEIPNIQKFDPATAEPGELLVPVFGEAFTPIAVQLAHGGASMVVGEQFTGKSRFMLEASQQVGRIFGDETLFVDGHKDNMSAKAVDETHAYILEFISSQAAPGGGVVFFDHFDSLLNRGDNPDLNRARVSLASTVFDLARGGRNTTGICIGVQQRDHLDPGLASQFGEQRRYDFTGEITQAAVGRLLLEHFSPLRINEIMAQESTAEAWTYRSALRLIETHGSEAPVSAADAAKPAATNIPELARGTLGDQALLSDLEKLADLVGGDDPKHRIVNQILLARIRQ